MSRKAKLGLGLAAALLVAAIAWTVGGRGADGPTAPAPRGRFATDRAAEEPALPVSSKP